LSQFLRALGDDCGFVREHAILALGAVGSAAKVAVPALIQILHDDQMGRNCRRLAARSLAMIDPTSPLIVQALIQELNGDDLPDAAIEALGAAGDKAKAAVPILIVIAAENSHNLRTSAITTLGNIGREARDCIPLLLKHLLEKDGRYSEAAADALGRIGPESEDVIPGLIRALRKSPYETTVAAAHALARIGLPASSARPILLECLKSEFVEVRAASALALGRLGPDRNVIASLKGALNDDNDGVRTNSALSLLRLGINDAGVFRAIVAALRKRDYDVAEELGQIGH